MFSYQKLVFECFEIWMNAVLWLCNDNLVIHLHQQLQLDILGTKNVVGHIPNQCHISGKRFRKRDFFWKYHCGAPGGPKAETFPTISHDPLYFKIWFSNNKNSLCFTTFSLGTWYGFFVSNCMSSIHTPYQRITKAIQHFDLWTLKGLCQCKSSLVKTSLQPAVWYL